jgi:hypothetical protein
MIIRSPSLFQYVVRPRVKVAAKNETQSYASEGCGYNLDLGAEVQVFLG